jgi:hypothetical protein
MRSPSEVLSEMLKNPTDIDHVRSLVTPDVTYVSLNYDNPDLKKIMPWAGTSRVHSRRFPLRPRPILIERRFQRYRNSDLPPDGGDEAGRTFVLTHINSGEHALAAHGGEARVALFAAAPRRRIT